MTQRIVSEPTPPTRTPGPYSSLNKALTLAERLQVKPTIQTVKTLEQRFAEFDETVRTCPNYNMDEESDSDIDVDMSQPGSSHVNMQTASYVDDLSSSELYELCSALDSLETESYDSDKENRALTPEYINPDSIVDLDSYSPVDREKQEIMDMWERFTTGSIKQRTSNEIINDAYRSQQKYLMGLISLAHMTTLHAPTP